MTARLCIILLVSFAAVGCDRIVVRKPTAADLAGSYALTRDSEAFLKKELKYATVAGSKIQIDGDGALRWENLPDCLFSPTGEAGGCFESFTGKWKIERYFYTFAIEPTMRKDGGPSDVLYAGPTMFLLKRSSLTLELMIGDPDSGVSIYYEKRQG